MNKSIKKDNTNRVKVSPRDQLSNICNIFLKKEDTQSSYEDEIEVRFGTKGIKYLNRTDYDNVIKKMKSLGFNTVNAEGFYTLKIETEFLDIRTGDFKSSNIRVEIDGIKSIQEYCKTNDISNQLQNVVFRKKGPMFINDQRVDKADFDDFNFRVTYSHEETINKNSKIAKDIIDNWVKTKKSFRYINRVSFIKEGIPFRIDLSIVKSSTRQNGQFIKTYNVSDSNVFNNNEQYEIEIELLNIEAKILYKKPDDMLKGIDQITKFVLSGLQSTNYPISYKEQNTVLHEYMEIIHKEDYKPEKKIYPSDFIGPSSKTLQIKNIAPVNPNMNIPNIRNNYAVTEKADGSRNLLFINKTGKLYLINTNMSVIFTGAKTEKKEYFNTIIDGELILHNKNGQYINLFAAFDIYFVNDQDIRSYGFLDTEIKAEKELMKLRLPILRNIISNLDIVSILHSKSEKISISPIKIVSKKFYPMINKENNKLDNMSIFDACNSILRNIDDQLYEYNTDGLIFTPITFGVGSDKSGKAGPLKKITWEYSFKWKPAEYNTIDFLITTKKSPNGSDIITPIFENGLNTSIVSQFTQYKTLILRCGFDENKHGYINPCQDVIDDKLPIMKNEDLNVSGSNKYIENNYKPVQFFPSDPYDPMAGICNILLEEDENNNFQMFTEERQVFEDNTIIEFKYDLSKTGLWRWIPLRVRYDKTVEYRQGLKNYGNAYNVANDNWYSIHNPITKDMISTGSNIPDELKEDDIYYNRITSSNDTKGLRDFHNLFVKKLLILSVANKGDTLIDYACGKGGDLPKWINANLSFVFGIDVSKDNLENRLNGACARFLNYKKEFKMMPYALFVNGNSSLNIRSGEALLNDKAVQITKAVFGKGPKDKLGAGVARQYGKGEDGFNISSCQFAVHYMFENIKTLHNYLRNIAECTKLGGYFIGTSYDGKTIFNKLSKKASGESIEIYENGKKIWQIVKEYNSDVLLDDESCIGYKINVFQESINQLIGEYLVNYDYLNRIMEDYGFIRMKSEDSKKLGLPESSGMFIELYNLMMNEITRFPSKKNDYGKACNMTGYEREISFLNRYFVYKKIRTVNAEKIAESFISKLPEELDFEKKETKKAQKIVKSVNQSKSKAKKLNKTIILEESPPPQEEKQEEKQEGDPKGKLPLQEEKPSEGKDIPLQEERLEEKPSEGKDIPLQVKKISRKKKLTNFQIEE
jgi:hypothetical protein